MTPQEKAERERLLQKDLTGRHFHLLQKYSELLS